MFNILRLQTPTIFLSGLLLAACTGGGGGGVVAPPPPGPNITSFELIDPTPGVGDNFGSKVVILSNGNVAVSDVGDSSVASRNGAVHLFNPSTKALIASFYCDASNDQLGSGGLVALANGNLVIVSPSDDENGIVDVGTVRLIDGITGIQIGATIKGSIAGDQLGSNGVKPLTNNNFVIASPFVDTGVPIIDAGSITLVNGVTGALIGSPIVGDVEGDGLGSGRVTALLNNNFVVTSTFDDEGSIVNASSVRLVDGTTGLQIGATIAGDVSGDRLGSHGITVLPNNNFVIASANDNEGGVIGAGSVRLFNGATGVQIGSTIAGDVASDSLGFNGITVLANGNFVIASSGDDEGGIVNAGSVRLIDSATGGQIGGAILGDNTDDSLGSEGVTALANNNFVIASSNDDEGGILNAGSVRLINGSTALQISSTIAGNNIGDQIGYYRVTALPNNNFVIVSPYDDASGIEDVGSVLLVNGTTGVPVSSPQFGETLGDIFGYSDITVLANNNFVIKSRYDHNGVITQAGSVRLVNGLTGDTIGTPILGGSINDELGENATALANNNFVMISDNEDGGGVVDAGTVRLVDGVTGNQISIQTGSVSYDMASASVTESPLGDFHILSFPSADKNGLVNSGRILLNAQ